MNDLNQMNGFEPADSLMREERAASAVKEARFAKSGVEAYWQRMRAYYDGTHDTARQTGGYLCDADLPWQPAGVPDGYLHVESAIDAKLPEFTFSARGEAVFSMTPITVTPLLRQISAMGISSSVFPPRETSSTTSPCCR